MDNPLQALRRRARIRGWRRGEVDGEWFTVSPDGTEVARVRAVDGHAFEARVWRYGAHPLLGPEEPSHGPQLFEACEDAFDYCEAYLMADRSPPGTPTGR